MTYDRERDRHFGPLFCFRIIAWFVYLKKLASSLELQHQLPLQKLTAGKEGSGNESEKQADLISPAAAREDDEDDSFFFLSFSLRGSFAKLDC